jgi:hypothetical protein
LRHVFLQQGPISLKPWLAGIKSLRGSKADLPPDAS